MEVRQVRKKVSQVMEGDPLGASQRRCSLRLLTCEADESR